jgi:hypothetical protein
MTQKKISKEIFSVNRHGLNNLKARLLPKTLKIYSFARKLKLG